MGHLVVLEEGQILVGFAVSEEALDRAREAAEFMGMDADEFMRHCLESELDEVEAAMGKLEAAREGGEDG